MNLKNIIRTVFGFLNFSTMIKFTLWWLWFRRDRVFFIFEGREYTYREVYQQSLRYAHFFLSIRKKLVDSGRLDKNKRLSFGVYMDNNPEFLFASFGAGLSNSILFAINSGFRGETLAKVMDQAEISLLIINESTLKEVQDTIGVVRVLGPENVYYVGDTKSVPSNGFQSLDAAVAEASRHEISKDYRVRIDNFSPVIVIYTSGTSGMPKGVPCTHIKMFGAGFVVQSAVHLNRNDRGYISMPLFHSNAWYIGILPQMIVGGSFVLKRRFSASAFEEDMLKYGVTFLNYVGQPLHYIIDALERKYGSGEAIEAALAKHPRNKFRKAYGNGATVNDRVKLKRYLGMEHIYEIYGSTEAVITTANRPGDPIDSVGRVDSSIRILNEEGKECAPGIVDASGALTNYDKAVGEICRKIGDNNLRFEGYFGNAKATNQKFRNGWYHSGDLGHIRMINGKRYMFFNGRTDDWIRKDGENFSAENVLDYAQKVPCVDCAIAYGAPCEVADEKVMITVQLKDGETFNPDDVYAWFIRQQKEGGMDPKWMPDYIRIIDKFTVTDTQKIIVRPFKREHFNIENTPGMKIYFRQRGDNTYRLLNADEFNKIKNNFIANGRETLLCSG
ncbi:MAG: AMP-binding protein [Smithella sp.]|nr:AMP-binding protein [Smithella sp.]MDM7987602.1 AMP-binding protein [Smithella sp.]HOU50396.1 AMP-binding protein [Smithella sp.]HQG64400.1 AMP-binding protein [Smithella sp.]HQH17368.1 AMP-binding protein [Smithella sp.]